MGDRKPIPDEVQADVLTRSRRRCCICFGLRQDLTEMRGQIAHLDRDPANNEPDNLAFLCLDHHDRYDGRTSQIKGLMLPEVKLYRMALYEAIEQGQHALMVSPQAVNSKQRKIREWKDKLVSVHRYQAVEGSMLPGWAPRNDRDYRVTDCDEHCVQLYDTATGDNFAISLEDLEISIDTKKLGRLLLTKKR